MLPNRPVSAPIPQKHHTFPIPAETPTDVPEIFARPYSAGNPLYATYDNYMYGPTFGSGHDVHVKGSMKQGTCRLGTTFKAGPYTSSISLKMCSR